MRPPSNLLLLDHIAKNAQLVGGPDLAYVLIFGGKIAPKTLSHLFARRE
jgi:hypothetical protein